MNNSQCKKLEQIERILKILKNQHDAAVIAGVEVYTNRVDIEEALDTVEQLWETA
jgi:hypothetical protein